MRMERAPRTQREGRVFHALLSLSHPGITHYFAETYQYPYAMTSAAQNGA